MKQQHPITPPPELVRQWQVSLDCPDNSRAQATYIATQAAQWGADQELEACCLWMERNYNYPQAGHPLRLARRPKPPSLKKQALAQTNAILNDPSRALLTEVRETLELIRRALEALDD